MKHLSHQEYITLFYPPYQASPIRGGMPERPLVDIDVFIKVRPYLTPHAQNYFDTVSTEEFVDFFMVNRVGNKTGDNSDGTIRERNDANKNLRPDFVKDPKIYTEVQEILRETPVDIKIADLGDVRQPGQYDYVYISNIGLNNEMVLVKVMVLLRSGAKRVGFTLTSPVKGDDKTGKEKMALFFKPGGKPPYIVSEGDFVLPEKTAPNAMPALHILGIDESVSCCILAEAREEDNKKK